MFQTSGQYTIQSVIKEVDDGEEYYKITATYRIPAAMFDTNIGAPTPSETRQDDSIESPAKAASPIVETPPTLPFDFTSLEEYDCGKFTFKDIKHPTKTGALKQTVGGISDIVDAYGSDITSTAVKLTFRPAFYNKFTTMFHAYAGTPQIIINQYPIGDSVTVDDFIDAYKTVQSTVIAAEIASFNKMDAEEKKKSYASQRKLARDLISRGARKREFAELVKIVMRGLRAFVSAYPDDSVAAVVYSAEDDVPSELDIEHARAIEEDIDFSDTYDFAGGRANESIAETADPLSTADLSRSDKLFESQLSPSSIRLPTSIERDFNKKTSSTFDAMAPDKRPARSITRTMATNTADDSFFGEIPVMPNADLPAFSRDDSTDSE